MTRYPLLLFDLDPDFYLYLYLYIDAGRLARGFADGETCGGHKSMSTPPGA